MSLVIRGLVGALLFFGSASSGSAACGDRPGDRQAIADTRAEVERSCDCVAARNHGRYVRCARAVTGMAVEAGTLPRDCARAVERCAARSTCGRPGVFTCCRTSADGTTRCAIKRAAAACTAPPGGSACVGNAPSCCDACSTSGCVPPTTTSTTVPSTTTTLPQQCGSDLECDDGNPCTQDTCSGGTCQHQCVCVTPGGTNTCCPGPATDCCQKDADCDDGNPCSHDICAGGICRHDCLCEGPGGGVSCCAGPECPPLRWFYTCGDPVCHGHTDHPGVRPCGPGETAGTSCSPEDAECDPSDDCNRLLVCATSDPTHGGQCPISRRRYKENVRYLSREELKRLHDELMKFRLTSYQYKPAEQNDRTHLGFIIEDVEPSASIDAAHDMVDLYGYTSMAVAALQTQAHEIAALEREVASLRRSCRAGRRRPLMHGEGAP